MGRGPAGFAPQARVLEGGDGRIVETVLAEEGRPPESVFDVVQGITAVAQSKPPQDARLVMEGKTKVLLERCRKRADREVASDKATSSASTMPMTAPSPFWTLARGAALDAVGGKRRFVAKSSNFHFAHYEMLAPQSSSAKQGAISLSRAM